MTALSSRTRLGVALGVASLVAILEFWGGIAAHSLALTTDAVHACTDVLALGLALFATIVATRPADRRRTFGYGRVEVLAALINGTILLCATALILFEAAQRFRAPLEVHGLLMTSIAAIGLVLNLGTVFLLLGNHRGHDHAHNAQGDVNMRAAMVHTLGDALGAGAVILGGIAITATGREWIDPALSIFVALIIVFGVLRVLRDATDVLLEGAPRGIDASDVRVTIEQLQGVVGVHDLHVWTIGSGSSALSAHVLLDDRRLSEAGVVLETLRECVRAHYAIAHVTVQFECEHCDPNGVIICLPERSGGA